MRDQLKRLEDLQRHDAKIQELESSLRAIPMKLAATENDLLRVEGLLSTERNALGETERYYAEQKGLMTDDEVQVAGAKHKLAQAKNSKEYMAAQREIEQRREALVVREGEITKLNEAGWRVLRVWECEVKRDVDSVAQLVERAARGKDQKSF